MAYSSAGRENVLTKLRAMLKADVDESNESKFEQNKYLMNIFDRNEDVVPPYESFDSPGHSENRLNNKSESDSSEKPSFANAIINVHHFTQFLYEGTQVYVYSAKLNEAYPTDPRKWSFFYVPIMQPVRSSIESNWVWAVRNEVRIQLALGNAEVESAARKAVADRYNDESSNSSAFWVIAPLMIDMLTGFIITPNSGPVEGVAPYQITNPNAMVTTFRFICSSEVNAINIANRLLEGDYNVEIAFHFAGLFSASTDLVTITGTQLKSVLSKTVADGGNTNATYIHRSQASSFIGMYMVNVEKMIYTEKSDSNKSSLMTGLQEEFTALFQQGMSSAAEEKLELGVFEQVWHSSDLNPDLVTSELNKLFTFNKSYTEQQNDSNEYYSYDRDFAFSSAINTAVSGSGWGFKASASVGAKLDIKQDDSATKHNIASKKRIDDLLAQQSVESGWDGKKLLPKSFNVFRLADITDRLQVALVAKQLTAEKKNKAITRLVAPLTTPGNSLVNFFIGEIKLYSGNSLPNNRWLFCNGSYISRHTYPGLFAVIGYIYGRSQSNASMFRLPDLRGRIPIGVDRERLRIDGFEQPGNEGGQLNYTLTPQNLPPHSHGHGTLIAANAGSHTHSADDPGHIHQGGYPVETTHSAIGYGSAVVENANRYFNYPPKLSVERAYTQITIRSNGDHTHNINGSTGLAGSGEEFTVLPPVQAFHYIIYAGQ